MDIQVFHEKKNFQAWANIWQTFKRKSGIKFKLTEMTCLLEGVENTGRQKEKEQKLTIITFATIILVNVPSGLRSLPSIQTINTE